MEANKSNDQTKRKDKLSKGKVSQKGTSVLQGSRKHLMILYNVIIAILSSGLLLYFVAFSPYHEGENATRASTQSEVGSSGQPDSAQTTPSISSELQSARFRGQAAKLIPDILLAVLITMASAGATGGSLSNLRGLFKYSYERGGLPTELEQPYYLRPLTGAVTGIAAFLIGYLITSSLSDSANLSWATLSGRLPYIGIALLAGFASQEFSERMKAVAETLFSQSTLSQLSGEDQLRKLRKMRDEGHISEDEYNLKRKTIVNKL